MENADRTGRLLQWWGRGDKRRGLLRLAATLVVGFALLWLGGLFRFAAQINALPEQPIADADGIVVLTGGGARLDMAIDLLLQGRAERLLITGVHPSIRAEDLSTVTIGSDELYRCCVDLGKSALNTRGNALETAAWAEARNYRSLIIVTANYHMPRSMLEFEDLLPQVTLIAFAVSPPDLRLEHWWRSPAATSLLAGEYTKYLIALLRHRF